MKYSDIPKFPQAHYEVDVSWAYLERNIAREQESELDLCPDFQRAHVWTREQQIAYVEYQLMGGESGKVLYFNHPGWMGSFEGAYVIVDGKQRLEAVRAFIRGDIPAFGGFLSDYEDGKKILYATGIKWRVAMLQTRQEVLQWYLAINTGGTPHTTEELDRVRGLLEQETEKYLGLQMNQSKLYTLVL